MADDLERLFDEGLPKGRKSLAFIKKTYDSGPQVLVNRLITDKLLAMSGLSFHIGTDDPTMRRIASWLLTEHKDRCDDLIQRLWKRCGREDVKLIGLLIANIEGDAWAKMLQIINKGIPIDLFLEMAEEINLSKKQGLELALQALENFYLKNKRIQIYDLRILMSHYSHCMV